MGFWLRSRLAFVMVISAFSRSFAALAKACIEIWFSAPYFQRLKPHFQHVGSCIVLLKNKR
jgi:hypothetical protein